MPLNLNNQGIESGQLFIYIHLGIKSERMREKGLVMGHRSLSFRQFSLIVSGSQTNETN
jgi:hypothetical protein